MRSNRVGAHGHEAGDALETSRQVDTLARENALLRAEVQRLRSELNNTSNGSPKPFEPLFHEGHGTGDIAQLDSLLAYAPVGFGFFDRQHRFVRVNAHLAGISGSPVEAHTGRSLLEVFPLGTPHLEQGIECVFVSGRPIKDLEIIGETQAFPGVQRHLLTELFPVKIGEEVGYVGAVIVDITARTRMEKNLRFQNTRLTFLSEMSSRLLAAEEPVEMMRELFRQASDQLGLDASFSYVIDESGSSLYLEAYTGISSEEARSIAHLSLGESICGRVAQTSRALHATNIQSSDDTLYQLVKALGLNAFACFPLSVGGRLLGTLSFASRCRGAFSNADISFFQMLCQIVALSKERLHAEEALRHSEEIYRVLFEEAGTGKVENKPDTGHLVRVNRKYCEITGYSAEELIGRKFIEITHPDDRTQNWESYLALLRGDIKEYHTDKRYIRKDGRPIWVHITATLLRSSDGKPLRTIAVIQDITEQKEAEETLRKREAELRTLNEYLEERVQERTEQVRALARELIVAEQKERQRIGSILHDDLQQILHGALIRAQIIALDVQENKQEGLDRQLDELKQLLITAIKTSRSLVVELKPPELEQVDLTFAMKWLAHHMLELHGLEVDFQSTGACPVAAQDLRNLVFQLTRELLFNVVKHARIMQARLTLSHQGDFLLIEVSDNGIGIVPDGAHSETSTRFGLNSVRERLSWMGGRLEIDSLPGSGTQARMVVPLN